MTITCAAANTVAHVRCDLPPGHLGNHQATVNGQCHYWSDRTTHPDHFKRAP